MERWNKIMVARNNCGRKPPASEVKTENRKMAVKNSGGRKSLASEVEANSEGIVIKKNDIVKLVITDMSVDGEGIGKIGEMEVNGTKKCRPAVFFVKNAVIGDEVLARVTKLKKDYGYAKLWEILKPSQDRVEPICPVALRCGGCQIMHLSYESQLRFKEEKVRNALERIGGQRCKEFGHIIGMQPISPSADSHGISSAELKWTSEEGQIDDNTAAKSSRPAGHDYGADMFIFENSQPARFRNKVQFPVGWDKEGHVVTGFYAGRTHYIVSASDCVATPYVNSLILEEIRQFIQQHRISTYNEETGTGLIRHILIRNGFATGQILICLVINADDFDEEDELVRIITGINFPDPWQIVSICLNTNKEKTNVILGNSTRCIYGNPYLEDVIVSKRTGLRPLKFRINPMSFFQTNPRQTSRLYDIALEYAGLTGKENVWDLYCGIGTISLFLAQKAGKVTGVEVIPEAIEDARANAARNCISNAEFICGKAEEVFPALAAEDNVGKSKTDKAAASQAANVVVLDPPRKGCAKELLDAVCMMMPERIVYVSCDPATLARDVKVLCEQGYELRKVQAVDMFPHTCHVETIVSLSKK